MNARTLVLFCFLISWSGSGYAAINGDTWIALSEEAKYAIVRGYNLGIKHGVISGATEAQKVQNGSDEEQSIEEAMSSQGNSEWEKLKKVFEEAENGYVIRHKLQDVVDQMNYLYKEPAARKIPWYRVYELAQHRLDGENVDDEVDSLLKRKPWKMDWLLPE